MSKAGAAARTAAFVIGVAVAAAGCRPAVEGPPTVEPPTTVELHLQDLVVDPQPPGVFDPSTSVRLCGDESHFSIALAAGDRKEYTATLRGSTELLLGACFDDSSVRPGADAQRELRARVFHSGGRREDHRLALGAGWTSGRFVLGAEAGTVRIRIAADLPAGERLFLRDLAVRSERPAPAPQSRPRAILISLDAFREDAIGAIGGRTRTPTLDRLLAESERFVPHWSSEIATKPSHATLLTGLPADVHGCDRQESALPESIETVAERIRATGAATGATMSVAPFFDAKFGLGQGFEDYRLAAWTNRQQLRTAADWASTRRDRASFQFVHLYGAHSDFNRLPYEAEGVTRATVEEVFGVADYGCRGAHCASTVLLGFNYRRMKPAEHEAEIVRFLYDRGVETLDTELGIFFDELRRIGIWDESLIVVTADHGESFAEHGYYLHTTAHEETLRVPLLVKWPGGARAGTVTDRPSTSLDVAPTILAVFGLASGDLLGSDLARPAVGAPAAMISRHAVRVGDLKLLLETPEFPRALYDLARDPHEQSNLLPGAAADAERLAAIHGRALERARKLHGRPIEAGRAPFTEEEIERLRSLGYLN